MNTSLNSAVVVVGGGLAAARTSEQLRKQGHVGPVTVLSAEAVAPYDRPPLSKAVLRGKRDAVPLRIDYEALDVELRLSTPAKALNIQARTVATARGEVPFDQLVIATGSVPVRLPGDGEQLSLRTDVDARLLRDRLVAGAHVVLIGASWIGAEVATIALRNECRVTCIEAGPAPLAQALGERIGARTSPWWAGVDLRLNCKVASVEKGGVLLADGEFLVADVVVTGVGVRPATGWLKDSGLQLCPAVVTDEALRTDVEGVVAVGDVAAWWSRRFGRRVNVEHWDNASAGAAVAAASLLGQGLRVHDAIPYFWSDQFGRKVEYVGHHGEDDRAILRAEGVEGWAVCWLDADDRLSAVLTVDRSDDVVAARKLIADIVSVRATDIGNAAAALDDCVT